MNLKYPLYKYAATILVTLTLSCQMLFVPAMAGQEEESSLNLNAQSAVLMDASTGRVLYGKEEDLILSLIHISEPTRL